MIDSEYQYNLVLRLALIDALEKLGVSSIHVDMENAHARRHEEVYISDGFDRLGRCLRVTVPHLEARKLEPVEQVTVEVVEPATPAHIEALAIEAAKIKKEEWFDV